MSIAPRTAPLGLAACLVAGLVAAAVPAAAVTSSVEPTWTASSDGGLLADDGTTLVRTSWANGVDGEPMNGTHLVYAAGTAWQPDVSPRSDRDVLISAVDPVTGEIAWSTRFDCGTWRTTETSLGTLTADRGTCATPGTDEELVAFDIRNSNLSGHFVVNVTGSDGAAARWQTISLTDGELATSGQTNGAVELPGVRAADMDTVNGTRNIIVGSKSGRFYAWSVDAPGTTSEVVSVREGQAGYANDVDITRRGPASDAAVATGYVSSTQGGGIRTELFGVRRDRDFGYRWGRTWESGGAKDEGIAATQGLVDGVGWVSFVTGRSRMDASHWDISVLAYENATGDLLWERQYAGPLADGDEEPVDIAWDARRQSVVVAGTSERGNHDQDIVLLSYDGATGAPLATTYAAGDVTHGDDTPVDLEIHPTQDRVAVLSQVTNFFPLPTTVMATLVFDGALRPAGTSIVSEYGGGRPLGGVAFVEAPEAAGDIVAGVRSAGSAGDLDQAVVRLPIDEFVVQTVATELSFTDRTPASVRAGADAVIEAVLTDTSGSPLAGEQVTFGFGPMAAVATTDDAGVAATTFDTSGLDGTYALTADFPGRGVLEPSRATSSIEVFRLTTSLAFTDGTTRMVESGDDAIVEARLTDADEQPVAGARIDLSFAGMTAVATADADGVAAATFDTSGLDAGEYDATAAFAGDDERQASQASTTIAVEVPVPDWAASAAATAKGVTVDFSASTGGDETVDITFDVDYFADGRPGKGVAANREADGVRALVLVVERYVDGQWIEVFRAERPEVRRFADAGSGDGPDWSLAFEAVDEEGTYRAAVDGVLLDEDGADLQGRGVQVAVELS